MSEQPDDTETDPLDGVVEDAMEPGKTRDAPHAAETSEDESAAGQADAPDVQAEAELDLLPEQTS